MYRTSGHSKSPQPSPRDRALSAATRHRVHALRLAAHVVEIIGANQAVHPTDIPLLLLRPVAALDACAAAAEIADVRRWRIRCYGRADCDDLVLGDGERVLDADVDILRAEARWLSAYGWKYAL